MGDTKLNYKKNIMEENRIDFNRNEDPALVEDMSGEMAKKVNKIYQDLTLNLGFCHEQLVGGTLTRGMMETHLSLSEHYVKDFLTAMGYEGILKRESEKRHEKIRDLNEQNRELRKQLGEKVTNEDFRERAKNISESIKRWWNIYGFGHTSEIHFQEWGGVKVKLSGMVSEAYYDKEHNHTRHDKVTYLKELGFDFNADSEGMIINDKNFESLTKLIKGKYPSAEIEQMTTYHRSRSGRTYGDIEVYIFNLDDVKEG